jgi:hypothetical protein
LIGQFDVVVIFISTATSVRQLSGA